MWPRIVSRWRRLTRRTLAPNRPLLYPEQYGLALASALVIVAGIVVVVLILS